MKFIGIVLGLFVMVGLVSFIGYKYVFKESVVDATVRECADFEYLNTALKIYKLDEKMYPSEAKGISILLGNTNGSSYVDRVPKDSWGNDYAYRISDPKYGEYSLYSLGENGVDDKCTGDDFCSNRCK